MSRFIELTRKAKHILKTEGLISLLIKGLRFVFGHNYYYLYEFRVEQLEALDEADYKPRIDDFVYKVIHTNQEADELEAQGFKFRSTVPNTNAWKYLENGAVALCIFVGKELGSINWLVMDEKAKDVFDEPPMKIDFSKHEAIGGETWTNPKYRRMRLCSHIFYKRHFYMRERGLTIIRGAVSPWNISIHMQNLKLGAHKYAELHVIKIFKWKFCKEFMSRDNDNLQTLS